jgi:hypothetical protein
VVKINRCGIMLRAMGFFGLPVAVTMNNKGDYIDERRP